MITGRLAAPLAEPAERGRVPLPRLIPSVPVRLEMLPGGICTRGLAADLTHADVPPGWLRLAPYDLDEAALDRLARAVVGVERASDGWWPLVVESSDGAQVARFLAQLAAVTTSGRAPCPIVLEYLTPRGRMPARPQAHAPDAQLGTALERLAGPRPAFCDSVLAAGRQLRSGELADIVAAATGPDDLAARLATRLLDGMPSRVTSLLGLAALLGYGHRRLGSLEPMLDCCAELPWWTPLHDEWLRFEPAWRAGVRRACRDEGRTEVSLLGRLVGELVDDGALPAAVELCLDAGYFGTAGDLLAGAGPTLVTAGHPRSVHRWLQRLSWMDRRHHRALANQLRAADPHAERRMTRSRLAMLGTRTRPSPVVVNTQRCEPAGAPAWPARDPGAGADRSVRVRLLGGVDVGVGEHRVARWHGHKGRLLLAYLLLHRDDRPVPRETLTAALWPDAAPDVSRNRLHVTLHALRADLLTVSPVPVVVFANQGYEVNPGLDICLDVEEFERAAARGNRAEREHDLEAALAAYRDAIIEYRGDLLIDAYADWTLLPRERYRVRMLDVLGRAAQLAFDTGRYAESVDAGQRLLAFDFCREDMHRLLMRAHARQGREHLAVRQFEACSLQLRRELDMPPARETVELCGQIRARRTV